MGNRNSSQLCAILVSSQRCSLVPLFSNSSLYRFLLFHHSVFFYRYKALSASSFLFIHDALVRFCLPIQFGHLYCYLFQLMSFFLHHKTVLFLLWNFLCDSLCNSLCWNSLLLMNAHFFLNKIFLLSIALFLTDLSIPLNDFLNKIFLLSIPLFLNDAPRRMLLHFLEMSRNRGFFFLRLSDLAALS